MIFNCWYFFIFQQTTETTILWLTYLLCRWVHCVNQIPRNWSPRKFFGMLINISIAYQWSLLLTLTKRNLVNLDVSCKKRGDNSQKHLHRKCTEGIYLPDVNIQHNALRMDPPSFYLFKTGFQGRQDYTSAVLIVLSMYPKHQRSMNAIT